MSVYVTQSLHRSLSDAGLVIALFGAGAVVVSLSGGILIKKIGFRATQISTNIATGILYIICLICAFLARNLFSEMNAEKKLKTDERR